MVGIGGIPENLSKQKNSSAFLHQYFCSGTIYLLSDLTKTKSIHATQLSINYFGSSKQVNSESTLH